MKRDMDKVRSVMLALEGHEGPFRMTMKMPALGDTVSGREAVEYITLLRSAGFLDRSDGGSYRISWSGHEFLDSVRDPEIWQKTKDGANKVGSWSMKLLGELAVGFARAKAQQLGLPII